MSTFCDNSELSDLFSICSDTSTIESLRSSGSNLMSPTSSLDGGLALSLSDASVTAMNN